MCKFVTPREMAFLLSDHTGRLVMVPHIRPDGDAAGSCLALALTLKAIGKNTAVLALEKMADEYDFLEGLADAIPALEYAPLPEDVMVVLDCGAIGRIAEPLRAHAGKIAKFCVDHHKDYTGFADFAIVDESAGSASELVMSIIEAGKFPITRGVAEAIWTGIVTDTGRFSYPSVTPETLRRAAGLIEAGARFDQINDRIFNRVDIKRFRLRNRFLGSFGISPDGKIAIASLSPEDYAAEDCDAYDSDSFIDIVRSVKGSEIAVFLRKTHPENTVKISMRTTEKFDAAEICKTEWGGGGHSRAAGAEISGSLPDVRDKVMRRLQTLVAADEN